MDFYRRMREVCMRIPEGKVATYGQIALLCGRPKNARQVGFGLRTDRAGSGIPAHRIVNSKGILSGAGAFAKADTQKKLLKAEGVAVKNTTEGTWVDLKKFGWRNTLDDAEELRAVFQKEGI